MGEQAQGGASRCGSPSSIEEVWADPDTLMSRLDSVKEAEHALSARQRQCQHNQGDDMKRIIIGIAASGLLLAGCENSDAPEPTAPTENFSSWTQLRDQYTKDFSVKCKDANSTVTCITQMNSAAESLLATLDDAPPEREDSSSGRAQDYLKEYTEDLIDNAKEYDDENCQTKTDDTLCGMIVTLNDTKAALIALNLKVAAK